MQNKYATFIGKQPTHMANQVEKEIDIHSLSWVNKNWMPEIVGIAFQKDLSFSERVEKVGQIVGIKQFEK